VNAFYERDTQMMRILKGVFQDENIIQLCSDDHKKSSLDDED